MKVRILAESDGWTPLKICFKITIRQQLGYERQAPFILERLQKELRERPEDDPILKALIKISGG
jgi:hypothetical protein